MSKPPKENCPNKKTDVKPSEPVEKNPPCYCDLGKAVKKFFTVGFNYGRYELRYRSKTQGGIALDALGACHHDSGTVKGYMAAKKNWKEQGLTLEVKGTNYQKLTMDLGLDDVPTKGVKLSCGVDLVPLLSQSLVGVKTAFENNYINTSVGFECYGNNMLRSLVVGSFVAGWKDNYLGMQVGYDVERRAISKVSLTAAHYWKDTAVILISSNWQDLHFMAHQKINDTVEVGAEAFASLGGCGNKIGFVAQYAYPKDIILKAKINTQLEMGLSTEMKLTEGVSVTFSTLVQGHRLSEACHKIGFALDLQL